MSFIYLPPLIQSTSAQLLFENSTDAVILIKKNQVQLHHTMIKKKKKTTSYKDLNKRKPGK